MCGTAMDSVLVNGSPTDEFHIGRGLRQGDPLSPFLFLMAIEGFNVLMNSMVEANLFKGYGVGCVGEVNLTHRQFADDTLIIGKKSWQNIISMQACLLLFEEISGLKVNFNKSMLTGVNISDAWLAEAALVMNYRQGTIPFVYLGLHIGGDSRKLCFWKPVVDSITARLSLWNNNFLSFGGRLILLKFVLYSLPVFFLSVYPTGIISSIEFIFKIFFWGGGEDNRKIAWIKWDSICVPKEEGGLGDRRVGAFNLALLGKWCWRMLVDKEGLWYRVLKSRYGEVGRRLKEGGRCGSSWWRTLYHIRSGVGEGVGRWFEENTRRVVGDAHNTLFWFDNWVVERPLSLKFPRLFHLPVNKDCSVEEMTNLGWEVGGRAWVWRRRLLAWEEDSVKDCTLLLHNVVLQDNVSDTWRWLVDLVHGHSVRETYRFLTSGEQVDRTLVDDVWHRYIQTKVSLFVWSLLRNRLPTKDNLIRRRVIQAPDTACAYGCSELETTNHLFLECEIPNMVWLHVRKWIGLHMVYPCQLREHYTQFSLMAGMPCRSLYVFKVIWFACVWLIWKDRNDQVFKNMGSDSSVLLEKIKLSSYL